jgi:ribosomal protein L24
VRFLVNLPKQNTRKKKKKKKRRKKRKGNIQEMMESIHMSQLSILVNEFTLTTNLSRVMLYS